MTVQTLKVCGLMENLSFFWNKVTSRADELNIHEPSLPRKLKGNARFESGDAEPEFHASVQDYYRQRTCEANPAGENSLFIFICNV